MGYRSVLSVVTPATTFDLTDLLAVKAALDINDATSQQNVWLRTAIKACSLAVARECNRVFPLQSYREKFYGYYGSSYPDSLQLSRWPLVEAGTGETLAVVTQDGAELTDGQEFIADKETGQLMRLTGGVPIWWAASSLTVEYDAGYATIPDDLKDIVHGLIMGQWAAFGSERDPFLRAEDIPGVASYQYATLANAAGASFAAMANGTIGGYKMPSFA